MIPLQPTPIHLPIFKPLSLKFPSPPNPRLHPFHPNPPLQPSSFHRHRQTPNIERTINFWGTARYTNKPSNMNRPSNTTKREK